MFCFISSKYKTKATTCDHLTDPANGYISKVFGAENTHDSMVEFHCNPGYYLTGEYKFVCKNTQWIGGDFPECERESYLINT